MQKDFLLPSFAYSGAASSIIVPLDQLPPGFKLRGILAQLTLNATQSAAAAAVTASTLNTLFSMLTIGKRFRATGAMLNALVWAMLGRDASLSEDIPATNSTAFLRYVNLWLPFADLDSYEPDDTSPDVAHFKDTPLQVDLPALLSIAPTLTTLTSSILRCTAVLEKGSPKKVATPQRINFADYSGQQVRLDPGSYTHIIAFKEDGTAFTAAEVSALSVTVDGEQVVNRANLAERSAIFNVQKAKGAGKQTTSATAAVAGEALPDTPAATGTTAAPSGPFLPIFLPRAGYKISKALHARKGVTIDFEGTLTSFRIAFRRLEPQSADQVVRAARKQGVVANFVKSATSSKKQLPDGSYLASLLPKKASATPE